MIGYYVHHHGAGHLRRMESITAHSQQQVTVLSSLPRPASYQGDWVWLAPDDQDPRPREVTAGGTLHWAPRHDPGLARRSAQILAWLADARPTLVVVDVSVEVALLVRLAGVPVVVAAMRGDRSDRPHVIAYDLADALLAPWSEDTAAPWPQRWLDKTTHIGALSRFDGWHRPAHRVAAGRPRALLLWGDGGGGPTDERIAGLRDATPGWDWQLAHPGSRLDPHQLWAALCGADVVVTHGGQNAVAEVAAARAPAVVVAGPRPFDEQHHTVAALRDAGLAVGLDGWPDPENWPRLLSRAVEIGGHGWRRWSHGDGGARAARFLDVLAARHRPADLPVVGA